MPPTTPPTLETPQGRIPEARVLIVMTGGTICMEKSPDGLIPSPNFLKRCMAPRLEFNDGEVLDDLPVIYDDRGAIVKLPSLRTPTSKYGKRVRTTQDSIALSTKLWPTDKYPVTRYTVFEFEELLDSSSIDSRGWGQIACTIYRNYKLYDGFVVLHGTDSLSYTGSALSFMLQNLGKPIILTGSQVPFSERKNDALENLLDSLDIAGHFMIPEVCLCFGSNLLRANRTLKISASAFEAFASPNLPPLAKITALDIDVNWNLVISPTVMAPFSIQTYLDLHVACIRVFPGIKPAMLEAVLKMEGLRALVLETFGAGNAPNGPDNAMLKVIEAAIQRGIVIVNITQCLTGSVSPVYAAGMVLGRVGVVAGGDMTTEAALTKLSYLLALPGATPESVARNMATPLRGEMTENSGTIFSRPEGTLSSPLAQLTAIAYAISEGNLDRVKDLLRSEPHLLNKADYSGNTPLHLAATAENQNILRYLLSLGASVHMRNLTGSGRTPLFLAANTGLMQHVRLLRQAGAHLHAAELDTARLHAGLDPDVWICAGLEV